MSSPSDPYVLPVAMSRSAGAVECVINISEGRDEAVIGSIVSAAGPLALDVHTDADHHRSVLTLGGPLPDVEAAARSVARITIATVDLRLHTGVHPRLGALDVVPFVALGGPGQTGHVSVSDPPGSVLGARDRFARWAGEVLALPCFLYGPERSLPELRQAAFVSLDPDAGPSCPHLTAGASAVGVRPILVAYNLWIVDQAEGDAGFGHCVAVARTVASGLRSPAIRALGLPVGSGAQVSMNLIDTDALSMTALYDSVSADAGAQGCAVVRAEVVGLVPEALLDSVPQHRWAELDLHAGRTIEARLENAR